MRERLSGWLRVRVAVVLSDRQDHQGEIRASLDSLGACTADVEARIIATRRVLEGAASDLSLARRPFSAEMTVDQAWRKHPLTQRVFARHHLPACDGCAVRFDETLAEATAAYGLDLRGLLEELNALL